ncbi:MAG: membrane-bound lytic murein transglycosylase D [Methylophagaceae bacterium]|jgi:membrane-bound lytic murein transglycosylase D
MKTLFNIKGIALIWLLALTLAACNASGPTVKVASVEPPIDIKPEQRDTESKTEWQESYGTKQELTPNSLSALRAEPEEDVWQRVRAGFVMTPASPLNKPTQKQLNRFLKNRKYLDTMSKRARPYLHHIVSELDKRNMPMEIALLPVIESGFKPYVYSSSGAAGIWQFMPATGRVFGLEQNGWYDGRRDIVASTDAALDYLQKLYGDFGDWQLALAAYNAGEGRVGRAIRKNIKAGKNTDFWSLDLPAETTAYVPKLMAVSHLVFQPSHYGMTLRPIENKPVFEVVGTGSQIDLALAAELAGITSDELYQFNPGFNYWATQPEGPHEIVLPIAKIDIFKRKLAALPIKDRMQWQRHKIKQGESLGVIAENYKTSVSVLKKTNKLASNNIRAGRHLLIPVSVGKASDFVSQGKVAKKKVAKKPKNSRKVVHIVEKGDTWWDLANNYDVGVRQLASWNGKLPRDTLSLGQKLTVWSSDIQISSKQLKAIDYQIKTGDSLWKISKQFDVSVAQVREWNGLSTRALLKPGQTLKLFLENSI